MKKYISSFILLIILLTVIIFNEPITNQLQNMLSNYSVGETPKINEYKIKYNFAYIKNVDKFRPYSYQELINVIYTVLNNGWNSFSFNCPSEYEECMNDIEKITNNNEIITQINNYVHPYNSFSNVKTNISSSGEIMLEINKSYTNEEIKEINEKIKSIIATEVNNEDDIIDKLRSIHDYIINTTTYDLDAIEKKSNYSYNTAYGSLIQGYAICGGYADAMALFLNYYNLPNYKISSDTHVWNAVKIDEKWFHLDVTWDDQIDNYGNERLTHKFFLINSDNLKKYAQTDHEFDNTIYLEFLDN